MLNNYKHFTPLQYSLPRMSQSKFLYTHRYFSHSLNLLTPIENKDSNSEDDFTNQPKPDKGKRRMETEYEYQLKKRKLEEEEIKQEKEEEEKRRGEMQYNKSNFLSELSSKEELVEEYKAVISEEAINIDNKLDDLIEKSNKNLPFHTHIELIEASTQYSEAREKQHNLTNDKLMQIQKDLKDSLNEKKTNNENEKIENLAQSASLNITRQLESDMRRSRTNEVDKKIEILLRRAEEDRLSPEVVEELIELKKSNDDLREDHKNYDAVEDDYVKDLSISKNIEYKKLERSNIEEFADSELEMPTYTNPED